MQHIQDPDQIVRHLRIQYGDTVLMVVAYDTDTYRVIYDAETADVQSAGNVYQEREMERIYDDLMLEEVGQPFQEQMFTDKGTVKGKIRIFNRKTIAHFWPTEEKEGLFISFNGDADPGIRSLLSVAQAYYN